MTSKQITEQIEAIASADDVVGASTALTEGWSTAKVGVECFQPVLRFIEEHQELDYGSPGPLVQFMESLYLKGHKEYENELIESLNRRPTILAAWMLNRILNVTKEPEKRQALAKVMRQAASNPKIDNATLAGIKVFLE